jgi:hypothetical protein
VTDFFLAIDGKPSGPFREDDLAQRLATGTLDPATLCWRNGMAEWRPVAATIAAADGPTRRPAPPAPRHGAGDVPERGRSERPLDANAYFVHMSARRYFAMSIFALGLFQCWWFYKNWRYVRDRDRSDILPFWRMIFYVFFTHSLLRRMHADRAPERLDAPAFTPDTLAWGYVVSTILVGFASNFESALLSSMPLWLPTYMFLWPAQRHVNEIVAARGTPSEPYPWTLGQWICVAFGGLFWLLVFGALVYMLTTGMPSPAIP